VFPGASKNRVIIILGESSYEPPLPSSFDFRGVAPRALRVVGNLTYTSVFMTSKLQAQKSSSYVEKVSRSDWVFCENEEEVWSKYYLSH
jgi:hypothetical protein